MVSSPRLWRQYDVGLLVLVAMLLLIGLLAVYSATRAFPSSFTHQLLWVTLGLLAMVVATMYDYRSLARAALPLYAFALVLLVAVRLHGHSVLGAKRWISVGGFQP